MSDSEFDTQLADLCADPDFKDLRGQLHQFDPFKVLKVERYELRHTTTLAWLLDPHETHGLGDTFLRSFLHEVFGSSGDVAHFLGDAAPLADRVAVQPELKLGDKKRGKATEADVTDIGMRARATGELDVLVESADWAIAIEAKIDSKEGQYQLSDYRDYLARRFGKKDHFQLRMLYLTVQDEPEVMNKNPEWLGIQWGRHVARALESALVERYRADPREALATCRVEERTLCEFLCRYMALLQRLATSLYGLEDQVQTLADRHNNVLLALKDDLDRKKREGLFIVPWLSSPGWARTYWENRQIIDVLKERARTPEAKFIAGVFGRLAGLHNGGVVRLSAEQGRSATIRFIPREWEDWKVLGPDGRLQVQNVLYYHMAFRKEKKEDIEIKLLLPASVEHALQAEMARESVRLGRGGCFTTRPSELDAFLARKNKTLKLYTLQLKWQREAQDYLLEPGQEEKLDSFWNAVYAHQDMLRDVISRIDRETAVVGETRAIGARILANPDLVATILESAQDVSAPMTLDEFKGCLEGERPLADA